MFTVPNSGQQIIHILDDEMVTEILQNVCEELDRAEHKFDRWPQDLNYGDQVINEEKGEATQALLDICQGKATVDDLEKEYVQTAAMCIRQIGAIRRMKEATNNDPE